MTSRSMTSRSMTTQAPIRILVVEDGHEYIQNLSRFLSSDQFRCDRAGSGGEALGRLPGNYQVVFLDMRFDRIEPEALLGDMQATADRYNGDLSRARQFLEENQGVVILSTLRAAGIMLPVLLSYDFEGEPRRWANLSRLYPPVEYLPDNATLDEVSETLRRLALKS